jgi:hypothetical protein
MFNEAVREDQIEALRTNESVGVASVSSDGPKPWFPFFGAFIQVDGRDMAGPNRGPQPPMYCAAEIKHFHFGKFGQMLPHKAPSAPPHPLCQGRVSFDEEAADPVGEHDTLRDRKKGIEDI